jgi:hypothetical protein
MRTVAGSRCFRVLICAGLLPGLVYGQTGLGNPAGGIIVILLAGALSLIGLVLSISGALLMLRGGPSFWKVVLLVGGLAALSPALFLVAGFVYLELKESLPQNASWDFSNSRSVSMLDPKKRRSVDNMSDHDAEYSFQGNIRSNVRLPSGRQWSGRGYLVIVDAMGDQITAIDWQGQKNHADQIYQQAKQILQELRMTDPGLEEWYATVRRGEPASLRVEPGTQPRIQVNIRPIPTGGDRIPLEKREWYVNVYVDWTSPER